ncbi:hypothetical protein CHELA1G11_20186 [Hyphomicrobiales bacterium]|nr:hypothetical protein CHELA1G11_20186 [Hyphomicrobiales bacterium]CAH1689030.1 hypothetical protein CHELA1G2_20502 [Hyphomicrobiales bacterium]
MRDVVKNDTPCTVSSLGRMRDEACLQLAISIRAYHTASSCRINNLEPEHSGATEISRFPVQGNFWYNVTQTIGWLAWAMSHAGLESARWRI